MINRRGLLAGVAAYGLWGLFPLYWPLLKPAGSLEILAHRVLWSLVAVLILLGVRRRWAWLRGLNLKQAMLLTLAAIVISLNWGTYIYTVNTGRTLEAALGYFINPLISVILGVLVFRERLRQGQWTAVGLGLSAVLVLSMAYGRPPWLAILLACAFGTYGMLKKYTDMPSAESLAFETVMMALPALGYLIFLQTQSTLAFGHHGIANVLLLAGSGVITAVPLMLFNTAATRIPLSMVGMLQYMTPSMMFLIGLLIQHESMPASRWAGFLLVWAALVTLTVDGIRAARRASARARGAAAAGVQPVRETT